MSVVPLVYLLAIGYSPVTIGLIYAASSVANTVGYAPFGVLADRFGRKKFLILGSALPALSYALFGLTLNPYLLIIASVIGGVGLAGGLAVAISSPSVLPLLADSSLNENRTTLFAVYQGVYTVGLGAGSFLSFLPSLMASGFSQGVVAAHSESYFIMAGLMASSVIPLTLVGERRKGRESPGGTASPQNQAAQVLAPNESPAGSAPEARRWDYIVSWPKIAKFSLVFGISGLGFGTIIQLLPTWYNLRFGVTEGTVGLWMAVAQLPSLVMILAIPLLVRRRGTVNVTVGAGIAACLPLFIMPFSGAFELAASLFIVRSIFIAINVPVISSYIAGAVSERERATTFGIVYTAWGLANSVGTVLAGDLLAANQLFVPFAIGATAYLASSLVFFAFFRGKRLAEEMPTKHGPSEDAPPP
jgi:MFS family permease